MKKALKILFIIFAALLSTAPAQTVRRITIDFRNENLPFGLIKKIPSFSPKVALALSGGGARGLAQIGAIRALKEAGIPIDIILGTSMGSIVGGLYASGYSLDELDSIAMYTNWDYLLALDRETNRRELFIDQKFTEDKAIFSLRLQGLKPVLPTSINSGMKLSNFLNMITFQAPLHVRSSFDDLLVKYRAVSSNLVTGEPVIIKQGSLSQAMRASSSVSFFLPPVIWDSLTLVDGGLVANIPVKIARETGGDLVVAINTTSALNDEEELAFPWIVADQIVSIPMKRLNEEQLRSADVVISPKLEKHEAPDFNNVPLIISRGYEAALQELPTIEFKLDSIVNKRLAAEEFYIKNIIAVNGYQDSAANYLKKYLSKDSISSVEVIKDLYDIFLTKSLREIQAEIIENDQGTTINFLTEEYPKINFLNADGITLLDSSTTAEAFRNVMGKSYNSEEILKSIIIVLDGYRKLGYSLAQADTCYFDEKSGALNIKFSEGIVTGFIIEGNNYTNTQVITREFPVISGDNFRYNIFAQGLTNLRSTNLFDDILLTAVKKGDENIVVLKVIEKIPTLARFGFRIDNEYKAQLSVDVRDENLFGTGSELGMLLLLGSRNRGINFEQKANRIFNTYLTYKINAYHQFEDILTYADDSSTSDKYFSRSEVGEYRQIMYGFSVSIGAQARRFGNLIFRGKYQVDEIKNLRGKTAAPYKTEIVSLRASTTLDTQDKYPYPEKGVYFTAFYETAQTIFGGDEGFFNVGFDYRNYFTLNNVHTFSPSVTMGFADKTLPLSQQYSLGGQSSFFGMRENEFRGRQIFLSSLEYRLKLPFQIFFDTFVKARYDLGTTWEVPEQIRFKDLKHGIGASISFDTPVGPAEFSAGRSFLFKKNLPGNPISLGSAYFYFSIGYYY